jgi:hypothetical protein
VRDLWTIPKEDLEKLKDEHIVLGMSGGKDSTACALLLEKNGIKFDRVFMDTGWEHPALYDYIKDVLEPRTTRGGKQIKMFDATANDGCTRWGMCESPLASSDLVKISEGRNESKEH